MEFSIAQYVLLLLAGIIAGAINSVAGGGSLLTLPALIFLGIPATVANATNRIGILFQSAYAITAFRKSGVTEKSHLVRFVPLSLVGAALGVWLATQVPDTSFEKVLGVIMIVLLVLILSKPKTINDDLAVKDSQFNDLPKVKQALLYIAFFLLGLYGGFIQAGMGIMTLLAFGALSSLPMMQANYNKLVATGLFTLLAVILFIALGVEIRWIAGIVLTVGQIIGSAMGTTLAIKKGEKIIRWALIIMTVFSCARLFGVHHWVGL